MSATSHPTLATWSEDVYSQNGEDGMIAECLRRLEMERGTCVEVGAHDGFTYSNTARLWHDLGWRAVLVEPAEERFRILAERTLERDCTAVHASVTASGENRLAPLLERAGCDRHVDVLSIDVDGDDIHILRGSPEVVARILVCEYNPTIPPELVAEGPLGTATGCSFAALVAAAGGLGYSLVGATATNAIFVRSEDAARFDDLEVRAELIASRSSLSYVVSDHRGRSAVVGPLPYRHRPGHAAFAVPPVGIRTDVVVRWTARGVVSTVVWKSGNVLARLRSPAAALAELRGRTRRRIGRRRQR